MPARVSVEQVRQAIYQHVGPHNAAESGQPSLAWLGSLFHETFGRLVRAELGAGDVLPEAGSLEERAKALADQAYRHFVGPRLASQRAALEHATTEVLGFWQAVRHLCHWVVELLQAVEETYPAKEASAEQLLSQLVVAEESLRWEVRDSTWSDSVVVYGTADAVVRTPDGRRWCVVELKLGRTNPEADLAQACLYHFMLEAASAAPPADSQRPVSVEADRPGQRLENARHFDLDVPHAAGSRAEGAAGPSAGRAAGPPPRTVVRPSPTVAAQPSAASPEDALAVVSFRPERHERLFWAHELSQVRTRLVELIGQVAGVAPREAAGGASGPTVPPRSVSATAASDRAENGRSGLNRNDSVSDTRPSEQHRELGRRLVAALREHGLAVELDGEPVAGPTFIRFRLSPGRGVTVRKLLQHECDIQLRLELDQPPFMSVSEGSVVVDVPRPDRRTLTFGQVREQLPQPDPLLGCPRVLLGADLDGQLQFADLSNPVSAHMLVAGTTGSGKTEWLRAALAGLLVTNTPETLRLLLIDPKRNAFPFLKSSHFLWRPVVHPDETDVVQVLDELVEEMQRRYKRLQDADSLDEHVVRSGVPLPRVVCVCDEYADLVAGDSKRRKAVEERVQRLGQKARAAGIHLILATQQPSRKIVQGALSTNLPARVALRTTGPVESRMLLDRTGAERLLGHGDLLYKDAGEPRRLQGVLLTREERERLEREVG